MEFEEIDDQSRKLIEKINERFSSMRNRDNAGKLSAFELLNANDCKRMLEIALAKLEGESNIV